MELKDFMAIHCGYNMVRREMDSKQRLTFEEFAILCKLHVSTSPMRTSDIADYQDALRPTMTHRTNHLAKLDLIERVPGTEDRRNVYCSLSSHGEEVLEELCEGTRRKMVSVVSSRRITQDKVLRSVEAMGSFSCSAGELTLLGLLRAPEGSSTISALVVSLGLLQPTVSMSVASLEQRGLVRRERVEGSARSSRVLLTDEGKERAEQLQARVQGIVVRRKAR